MVKSPSDELTPANVLPQVAKNNGAVILENNLEHTRLTDYFTDYFLPGPAGEVWPEVMQHLQEISGQ